MRREIWRVKTDDWTNANGDQIPYLTYNKPLLEEELVSSGADNATLEELVALCDQDAENCNAHEFCGSHRLLGALLHRHVGRTTATKIMLDIAMYGGQHGMGGVCRSGDAYADLNVGRAGHDWDGRYPA
jgi:hypothetical protein